MKLETMKLPVLPPEPTGVLYTVSKHFGFEGGGWIAGGFARQVAHHLLVKMKTSEEWEKYLEPERRRDYHPGDVDVFLPKHITHVELEAGLLTLRDSYAQFAKNLQANSRDHGRMNIQFVTAPEFRYNGVQDCLAAFDLYNARYAITYEKPGEFVLHWDPRALVADRLNRVSIVQTLSPFLGSRVLKYIEHRDCGNGLMPDSNELLLEWLVRVATGAWPDNFDAKHIVGTKGQVMKLREAGYVKTNELAFFINRWKITGKSAYGFPGKEVDWACDQIDKATT
jgi:hypothetical protein